jgi:hypothetical protein
MKKALIAVFVLSVLAGAGAGGWWYAADKGLIPGKPNSPRPENFKLALDQYLSRTAETTSRPCANVGYYAPQGRSFPDVRFDWTPVGFRAVIDPRAQQQQGGNVKGRLALLEKQGYFQSSQTADGATEYTMTWKGYAASNASGCFHMASVEREAKIIGFEKKRIENAIEIYEVTAQPRRTAIEAWAETPEFKEQFSGTAYAKQLEPDPVTYELARGETGFSVIGERGRQPTARTRSAEDTALLAKLAGTITAARVKKAVESWLEKSTGVRSSMCLRLPMVPGEADEMQPDPQMARMAVGVPGAMPASTTLAYAFYNLPGRQNHAMEGTLRGFETMRRLESLGLAKSELLSVSEFRGVPALGAVRYEVSLKQAQGYQPCFPVGTLHVDEVVSVQQFSEANMRPRFVARMAFKPGDDEAKRIVEKFGHLARVAAVGTVISGTLRYSESDLAVEHAQVHVPQFFPDMSGVALPVISVTPSKTSAQSQPSRPMPGYATPVPAYPGYPAVAAVPGVPTPAPAAPMAVPGVQAFDVHAIGVYEGAVAGAAAAPGAQRPEGTVTVTVRRLPRAGILYLSAYEPVHWVVSVTGGARLLRIVTSGYHPQRVTLAGASGVQVLQAPYAGSSGQAQVAKAAAAQLGAQPVSTQYTYKGASFEIGAR